jgi:5-methylcytosine-specific restriction endonuclease McrA
MGKSTNYRKVCDRYGAHWEPGITRGGVLKRDNWTCRMEICLYGDRRIDPTIKFIGPGVIPEDYGSVDHIVPLSVPGTPGHVWPNVRASHRSCNRESAGVVWLTQQVARDWFHEQAPETAHLFEVELGIVKVEGPSAVPSYRVVARAKGVDGSGETLFPQ